MNSLLMYLAKRLLERSSLLVALPAGVVAALLQVFDLNLGDKQSLVSWLALVATAVGAWLVPERGVQGMLDKAPDGK